MTPAIRLGGLARSFRTLHGRVQAVRRVDLSVEAGETVALLGTAYTLALVTIALLYAAGLSLGVAMPGDDWLSMTGLVLVGAMPFAALGLALGHVLDPDAVGPAAGGTVSLLALISGTWFPLGSHSFLHAVAQWLPSYWLVEVSRVATGGEAWGAKGWIVVLAWTAVLSVGAYAAYRRDTERV
jgi:ABC-2 type transport system permease protein